MSAPGPGRAALPMYDWAAVRAATDALWRSIRGAAAEAGLALPAALDRETPARALWQAPDLALAQTCGLPFATRLAGRVALVGTPDYGLPGCPPGWYRSALVVRRDDPRESLDGFRGARLAVNDFASQSGWQAILAEIHARAPGAAFFAAALPSGAHAASVAMVAEGRADIAAIDHVSWRLAEAHLPAARELRVLALTEPTPGLPLIAAPDRPAAALAAAVAEGIAALDGTARAALGLRGFRRLAAADYAPLAAGAAARRATEAAQRAAREGAAST